MALRLRSMGWSPAARTGSWPARQRGGLASPRRAPGQSKEKKGRAGGRILHHGIRLQKRAASGAPSKDNPGASALGPAVPPRRRWQTPCLERQAMTTQPPTIIYTLTDEAPRLATASFLPIISRFPAPEGLSVIAS